MSAARDGMSAAPAEVVARRRTARLAAVRAAMREAGYGALVVAGRGIISQYGYLEYVSGYSPVVRAAYSVIGPEGDAALVVPTVADAWQARRLAALEDVRVAGQGDLYSEYDDLAAGVASAVADHGAAAETVGIVGLRHIVSAGDLEQLRARLPDARLVDATQLLAELKAVKDAEELDELRRTAAVADAGYEAALASLRAGAVAREVCAATEEAVRARGARGEVLIFVSAAPYFLTRPDEERFAPGDLVTAYVELTGPTGYWVERAGLVAIGALDGREDRARRGDTGGSGRRGGDAPTRPDGRRRRRRDRRDRRATRPAGRHLARARRRHRPRPADRDRGRPDRARRPDGDLGPPELLDRRRDARRQRRRHVRRARRDAGAALDRLAGARPPMSRRPQGARIGKSFFH